MEGEVSALVCKISDFVAEIDPPMGVAIEAFMYLSMSITADLMNQAIEDTLKRKMQ